jgi:putative cell wall-binding protein
MSAHEPKTVRLAGANAVTTAVKLSKVGWKTSRYVVIARDTAYADAIAGSALAGAYGAPVLLTGKSSLAAATAAEIKRLKATKAFVLGGTGTLSARVASQLKARKLAVTRISGADRYALASAVALKVKAKSGTPAFAMVVGGTDYAAGLAAAVVAARNHVPVLLTASTKLPSSTSKAISTLRVKHVIIVGTSGAVSSSVQGKLPGALRISGANRYDTAAQVAEWGLSFGITFGKPMVASGVNLSSALGAAALGGRLGSPLLFTSVRTDGHPTTECINALENHCTEIGTIYVLGSTKSVSESIRADLATASAVLIPDTTKVLAPATMDDLSAIEGSGAVLTFSQEATQASALETGDVVVSGVTTDTPNGLLRKVVSVQDENGQTVVHTVQANLSDAVGQASMDYHADLKPSDVAHAVALTDGVTFGPKHAGRATGANALSAVFTISLDHELYKSGDKSITMEGQLELEPSVDFSASYGVSYKWHVIPTGVHLKHLYCAAGLAETLTVNVNASYSLVGADKTIEVARYYMAPVTVPCGPVPVVIEPVLTVDINLKGEVSVGVETGVVQSASITAGLRYDNDYNIDRNGDGHVTDADRWRPVWEFNKSFTFNRPSAALKVEAKASAGPEIAFEIYGIAGPYIQLLGFVEFDAEFVPAPSWDLYAGIGCYAGMKLEVFSYEIADISMTVVEWRTLLWHGPGDTTPPGEVMSFTATPGDRHVNLSWVNPTDSDFKTTRILRSTVGFATSPTPGGDQTQFYEGTATSALNSNLTNGTRYYYTAFTCDNDDNWSGPATASAVPTTAGGGGGGSGGFNEGAGYLQTTGDWTIENYYDAQHDLGSHEHTASVTTTARYEGSKALYIYAKVIPPAKILHDPSIPMGAQIAVTRVISPAFDAGSNTKLELWTSQFTQVHESYWGWGDSVWVQFSDAATTVPVLLTPEQVDAASSGPELLRIEHEAPFINSDGIRDTKISSATGADRKTWSRYRVTIPAAIDKSSMHVAIAAVAFNWNSWGTGDWNSVGCYVDGLKLVP